MLRSTSLIAVMALAACGHEPSKTSRPNPPGSHSQTVDRGACATVLDSAGEAEVFVRAGATAGACSPAPAACGGDLTGEWTLATACGDLSPVLESNPVLSACPGAYWQELPAEESGTVSFDAAGSYTLSIASTAKYQLDADITCIGAFNCGEPAEAVLKNVFADASCTGFPTACSCVITAGTKELHTAGTYSTRNDVVTFTGAAAWPSAAPFCSDGDELRLWRKAWSVTDTACTNDAGCASPTFCLAGGKAPTGWTCDTDSYGSGDGCDCGCGALDPDCGNEPACSDAGCNASDTSCDFCYHGAHGCLLGAVPATAPDSWTCDPSYYGTSDGCDCGCGIVDPDCGSEPSCTEPGCIAPSGCDYCSNGAVCWECDQSHYGSGDGCDCTCGLTDPDCGTEPTCNEWGCDPDGETCDYWGNGYITLLHGENVPGGHITGVSLLSDYGDYADSRGCAVYENNVVECWGDLYSFIPPYGRYAELSLGEEMSCGLRPDGTLRCWGRIGEAVARPSPETTFKSVSVGYDFACALGTDGAIACFGGAELDSGTVPALTPPEGRFLSVGAAGGWDAPSICGLREDGAIVCWGQGAPTPPSGTFVSMSLGPAFGCAVRDTGEMVCFGPPENLATPPSGSFKSVSVGPGAGCAVKDDDSLVCFGTTFDGPLAPAPSGTFASVVMAGEFGEAACGLRTDGSLDCWGVGTDSGEGHPPVGSFDKIEMGDHHACALANGTIQCWGSSDNGRIQVPPGTYTDLSVGNDHACALRSDSTVACWGKDDAGETSAPTGAFKQLSAGTDVTCGIRSDDTIDCWGLEDEAPPAGPFKAIASGTGSSDPATLCGLRASGEVVCWGGYSDFPESGSFAGVTMGLVYGCVLDANHAATCWPDETLVPVGETFLQLSSGSTFVCGLHSDGSVSCYGDWPSTAPIPTGPFTAIDVGDDSACGRRSDGSVACWGDIY